MATPSNSSTFNFTKTAIEALPLPAPGQRSVFRDTKVDGLELRLSSSGTRSFSVYRRVKGGEPIRVTLGRFPEMSVEQARRQAQELLAEIVGGSNPAEVKRILRQERTFGELFTEYIERHAKPHKRTWQEDEQRYQQYLERPLGRKKLSSIDRGLMSSIHSDITRAGHPVVANRVISLASSVFGRAIEWQIMDSNPAIGIRRNREQARDRFLQVQELPRFFTALQAEENDIVRDYILVSLFTGARRENVSAMRWAEVNFDECLWRIPRTKNGDPQNVTLAPEVMEILVTRQAAENADGEFVFPGPGKTGHIVEPRKGWLRLFDQDEFLQIVQAIEKAEGRFSPLLNGQTGEEIPEGLTARLTRAKEEAAKLGINTDGMRMADLRIHDLRRTLGSWMAKGGASISIIGKSLNHKNVATTAIYARLDLDPVRQSVETATKAMLGAATGAPVEGGAKSSDK